LLLAFLAATTASWAFFSSRAADADGAWRGMGAGCYNQDYVVAVSGGALRSTADAGARTTYCSLPTGSGEDGFVNTNEIDDIVAYVYDGREWTVSLTAYSYGTTVGTWSSCGTVNTPGPLIGNFTLGFFDLDQAGSCMDFHGRGAAISVVIPPRGPELLFSYLIGWRVSD
jgi:hypothetical protein